MPGEESKDINFTSSDATPDTPRGKNHLFAIAIDKYQHYSKLNNAVFDVEEFIKLMTQRYQFEKENITLLVDEEATKKRIEQHFGYLVRTLTERDNLIVYFSGHGMYDERLYGHWIPVEGGPSDDDWPDYISNDTVKSYLDKINSHHTFLIADSCFSGSIFIDASREKSIGDRREKEPSRWGLTSGKKEIVSDGPPGQHSPFASALLDVLKKADKPVPVMGLCHFVLEKVVANAQQTPMGSPLVVKGHQGGQFVFHFRLQREEKVAVKHEQFHQQRQKKEQQKSKEPAARSTRKGEGRRTKRRTYFLVSLSAIAVVFITLMIWRPWEPVIPDKPPESTQVKPLDSVAFQLAKSLGTIPAWENFLKAFPESDHRSEAKTTLRDARKKVAGLLKDAEVLINTKKQVEDGAKVEEAVCQHLKEARLLDPQNAKLETIRRKLKNCTW